MVGERPYATRTPRLMVALHRRMRSLHWEANYRHAPETLLLSFHRLWDRVRRQIERIIIEIGHDSQFLSPLTDIDSKNNKYTAGERDRS